jgi:hypothetical protein
MSRLGRTLNKPTVVLAVAVVAVALHVLLYYGLPVLLYHNPLVPRLPPLIPRSEPLPAEDSIIVPTPPSKTLLEPKPDPEGDRGGDGA